MYYYIWKRREKTQKLFISIIIIIIIIKSCCSLEFFTIRPYHLLLLAGPLDSIQCPHIAQSAGAVEYTDCFSAEG